jgi:hypothetical protein
VGFHHRASLIDRVNIRYNTSARPWNRLATLSLCRKARFGSSGLISPAGSSSLSDYQSTVHPPSTSYIVAVSILQRSDRIGTYYGPLSIPGPSAEFTQLITDRQPSRAYHSSSPNTTNSKSSLSIRNRTDQPLFSGGYLY